MACHSTASLTFKFKFKFALLLLLAAAGINVAWSSTVEDKLTASDAAADDFFGESVSLSGSGDVALVGASGNDDNGRLLSGNDDKGRLLSGAPRSDASVRVRLPMSVQLTPGRNGLNSAQRSTPCAANSACNTTAAGSRGRAS